MLKRTFRAFSYRDFRIMWLGACTSSIGTWMQILAQSWLVYKLSNSSLYLGLDAFFGQIPIFLFSLFGGVFADRKSRRALLIVSQIIQMTCAFVLAGLAAANAIKVWEIWCLSFTVGIAQSFGGPAYSALIPTLVGKEDISNAIALNSIQFNLARVVGPMLGGLALSKLGAVWCFGLNGLSFLAVIFTLVSIKVHFVPQKTAESVGKSIKQGLSFIRAREGMTSLVVLGFLVTLLSFPLITFLPVMARDVFHGGPNTFTLFLCLSGAGSVTGALSVAARQNQKGQGRMSLIMMLLLGIFIAMFGASKNLAFAALTVFAAGACLMIVFAMNSSLVQLYVDETVRGRVMSVYNVAFRGGMPFGSVLCGYLIKRTSAPTVMMSNGVLVMLVALYFLLVQRRVLKL